tara:strand:+ start:3572 stop:5686 length:2115 start_codon:yes stop_codon:yes gene_type:complete
MKRRGGHLSIGRSVEAMLYDETYYTRNDIHKRYPRTAKRIRLSYGFNREANDALKRELRKIEGFYNCKFDNGSWSIRYAREVVEAAILVFEGLGYDTSALEEHLDAPQTTDKRTGGVEAHVLGDALAINWPWIPDMELRDKVREIVKGVPNRKFDSVKKKWLIPIKQAGFLEKRLRGTYDELADKIASVDDVQTYIEKHAERVSISSASELNNEDTIADMKQRLSEKFNDGMELYPFQYVGVRFAELSGGRCLIGDDMGLGKTLQAIAYASLHEELWPVLVVCPANVKYNWVAELDKFLSDASYQVVSGYKGELEEADFTIVNYDLVAQRKEQLLDMGFNLVIFDESHYLKNNTAKRTKASLEIGKQAQSVLCLSGTAITSRPEEYFTTLNLLRPIDYPSWLKYVQRYCDAYHNGYGWDTRGASNTDELHAISRDFVIRRLKKEVLDELPDKVRQEFKVNPSTDGMKAYKDLQSSWLDQYRLHKMNHTLPPGFILNMLTDLRHHCGMLKAIPAVEWVEEYVKQTGKPVVVFTHHKDVLSHVCDNMSEELTTCVISGEVKAEKRQAIIDSFQAGEIDVLVCNIISANVGITLTAADTVVFVEREWVPAVEEQAEDRVNRIGQKSQNVHAVYLSVSNTIDEKFARIVSQKREVVKSILDGGEGEQRHMVATELLKQMVEAGEMPAEMLGDFALGSASTNKGTTKEW